MLKIIWVPVGQYRVPVPTKCQLITFCAYLPLWVNKIFWPLSQNYLLIRT